MKLLPWVFASYTSISFLSFFHSLTEKALSRKALSKLKKISNLQQVSFEIDQIANEFDKHVFIFALGKKESFWYNVPYISLTAGDIQSLSV